MTADTGLDLGVFAQIGATLGRVADMMQDREHRRQCLFQQLHQVPIAPPQLTLTAGAGALQMPDLLSPKAGYMWSVRRLTATGFTAGTVIIYKNGAVIGGVAVGGEPVMPFATAGVATIGRGELLLDQNDSLVIAASGITGYVQVNGAADCFERWLLPEYIG